MELQEVVRRIVIGHRVVILAFLILSMGAVLAYHLQEAPTYSASTRVILDFPNPSDAVQAATIADAAKAIVTSPSHVQSALRMAGVVRDPILEGRSISVVPMGTSGVLQITVQDTNPAAAAGIANALTHDLIQTRLASGPASQIAGLDDQIKGLDDQIKGLDDQLTSLDQQLASLNAQLQALPVDPTTFQTSAVRAQILTDQIAARSAQRSTLTQEVLTLEGQRANLAAQRDSLAAGGSRPAPTVIELASAPAAPDPSRLPIDMALAFLGGLVLGVLAASALEIFRPTLTGGEAIANALGVPVLGWIPDPTGTLPRRLKQVATAAEIGVVELIGAGDTFGLAALAKSLRGQLGPDQAGGKRLAIYSTNDVPTRYRNGHTQSCGLVVVVPESLPKAALAPVTDLVSNSGRTLLGVITHRSNRPATKSAKRIKSSPAPKRLSREGTSDLAISEIETGETGMSKEMMSDLWGVG
jgi:capsular polysaccharide biosynthesis protein